MHVVCFLFRMLFVFFGLAESNDFVSNFILINFPTIIAPLHSNDCTRYGDKTMHYNKDSIIAGYRNIFIIVE